MGFVFLSSYLELRQVLFLVRIRDGFVGLERRHFLLDLFTRLSKLLARPWESRAVYRCVDP